MNAVKIAPELLLALQNYTEKDYMEEELADLSLDSRTLSPQDEVDSPEPSEVDVFLHCDESAALDHLEDMGIQVNARKGSIRTAKVPLPQLYPLSEDLNITHIGASHTLHPLMDVAPAKVRLPEFRRKTHLTGKGVIIGVVDTGIDSNHPAFQGRILRILDQKLGLELTSEDFSRSHDTDGHGTHVAGIAAGNDDTFGGVAPEAELVIVKTTMNTTDILEGIHYIFEVADELNKPAVVNISLGGHYDPHDGSDSLSRGIDESSGEGKIVCCSAGNEGDDDIHAQVHLSQNGDSHSIHFSVPESSGNNTIQRVILNGWYSGRDQIEVAIQPPDGPSTAYQPIPLERVPVHTDELVGARIHIVTPSFHPINEVYQDEDYHFWIEITSYPDSDQPVPPGNWQLQLHGREINSGRVDVWVIDGKNPPQVVFTEGGISDSLKIGSPGAARRAITVASYTTKVKWEDIDGIPREAELSIDDISDFSSEGPLRNGVQKPDVTAPGAYIASCMSDDVDQQPRWRQINSHYTMMAGTSMSAPFISGIVALLLQHDPTFSPERIKALLQESSSIPGNRLGSFHPKWGYGLINADALADALVSVTS